jgi:hypothetical protein
MIIIKRRKVMARHSRANTENQLKRNFDIASASKDELIEYLCQTIQSEVEKGEGADCDLIRECSDWLDELTADEITFTPEELALRLEVIKSGKIINEVPRKKMRSNGSISKPRIWSRVTILVASMILLSLLSLTVMAIHAGYDSVWTFISTNFMTIIKMNSGEMITGDGITIIKNSEQRQYNTIEELLAAEKLNIMYPSEVPNNQSITEIRWVPETDDQYVLYLVFSDKSYTLQIINYYMTDLESLAGYACISVNDLDYYIISIDGISYHAICQYNGFEYSIDSPNYDDLINIINSMKG